MGREPEGTESARRSRKRRADSFVGNIRHPIIARFGAAVRARRKQLGLTQAQLAEMTKMSRSYVSEVECGKENISLERAEKIARALECRLVDLLEPGENGAKGGERA